MEKNNKVDNFVWLLTCLMFACFSISTTNSNWSSLSLAIITALVLVTNMCRRGLNGIRLDTFHYSIFVFAMYCFISSLWAINPSDAIEKGITITEILLSFSVFYWTYTTMPNAFVNLLKAIMWGGYIVVAFAFATDGINGVIMTVMTGGRLESSFDNVNAVALLCAFSIILSIYFILDKKSLLLLIMDLPTIVLLAACGSRKAMVILVLGSLAVYLFKSNAQNKAQVILRIITTFIFLIITLFVVMQMEIFAGLNQRMEGLIAMLTGVGDIDHSAMVRQEMSELGYKIFFEHPLGGIGAGNAHIIDAKVLGEDCYLHNNYAEVLANGGIIGFFLYYRLYYRVFLRTKRQGSLGTPEGRIVLILLVSILLADFGLVSYYSKIYYFFLLTFNIYLYHNKNQQRALI